jgi:hypothetical protein
MTRRTIALVCVALGSSGCAAMGDGARAEVLVRAEKDLICPQDRIDLERKWGGKYVARGCGRKTTYDTICEGVKCNVSREGEEAPAWRGRPDPGSPHDLP